jgi:hypothetical protein
VGYDDHLVFGSLKRIDHRLDPLPVAGIGIMERQVGGDRAVPPLLETGRQQLPAPGIVPGAVEQA